MSVERKIPVAMATQHPDSASRSVSVQEEVDEALLSLSHGEKGFGCDEYLIDYMGKLTPYHQIGQVIRRINQGSGLIPGRDVFITPRLVSSFEDEPFRQLMAILAIMEGIYYSMKRFGEQGVIEFVQAMPKSVWDLKRCRDRVNHFFKPLAGELNGWKNGMELRVIPLLEGVPEQVSVHETLPKSIKVLGVKDYFRVFLGKSETALVYGHPASVLSCKLAISDGYRVREELGVEVHPILGGGALPFRGHFTLANAGNFLNEYSGVKTYTVQSGMIYDHGVEETRKLVETMKEAVQAKPLSVDGYERGKLMQTIAIFAKNYLTTLSEVAEAVSKVAEVVPDQRDRVLSSGYVSYYRELRKHREIDAFLTLCPDSEVKQAFTAIDRKTLAILPRAVKFTAALYTCGLPPEFLGTGEALREISERMGQRWLETLIEEVHPSLKDDIQFASKFLNPSPSVNIVLTPRIKQGIDYLREYFTFEEPDSGHQILTGMAMLYIKNLWEGRVDKVVKRVALTIYPGRVAEYLTGSVSENLKKLILDMGKIRGSLG